VRQAFGFGTYGDVLMSVVTQYFSEDTTRVGIAFDGYSADDPI